MKETAVEVFKGCGSLEDVERKIDSVNKKHKFDVYHLKAEREDNRLKLLIYMKNDEKSMTFCRISGYVKNEGESFIYRYRSSVLPDSYVFWALMFSAIAPSFLSTQMPLAFGVMSAAAFVLVFLLFYFFYKGEYKGIVKIIDEIK